MASALNVTTWDGQILAIDMNRVVYARSSSASDLQLYPLGVTKIAVLPDTLSAGFTDLVFIRTAVGTFAGQAENLISLTTIAAQGTETVYVSYSLALAAETVGGRQITFNNYSAGAWIPIVSDTLASIKAKKDVAQALAALPADAMLTSANNLMAGANQIQFRTATNNIGSSVAGQLDINALTLLALVAPTIRLTASVEAEINALLIDMNSTGAVTVDAATTIALTALGAYSSSGTTNTATGSTSTSIVSGPASVSVTAGTGEVDLTGTIVDINATGPATIDSGSAIGITAVGILTMTAGANLTITTPADVNVLSGAANVNVVADLDLVLEGSNENVAINAPSAGKNITLTTPKVVASDVTISRNTGFEGSQANPDIQAKWSFVNDGGAVGAPIDLGIQLRGGDLVRLSGFWATGVTGAVGCLVSVGTVADSDAFRVATAVATYNNGVAGIQTGDATLWYRVPADTTVAIEPTVAALTAGVIDIYLNILRPIA